MASPTKTTWAKRNHKSAKRDKKRVVRVRTKLAKLSTKGFLVTPDAFEKLL